MPKRYNKAMELRHLRSFLAVAEDGTVTAAASRLHLAQPALSRQLRRLEKDVGVTLFTRNGPRLALTDAGRHMLGVAADIVTRADRATMAAQRMANGYLTRVAVAAASTTIDYVLAPFAATLCEEDPFVSAHSVAADAVHQAVLNDHDIGLSAASPPVSPLAWRWLTSVPLRAYVAPDHAWAERRNIPLAELVGSPLLLPNPHDPTRAVFDEAVNQAELRYEVYQEVEWPALSQGLAAANRGIAVVTDLERLGAIPLFIVNEHNDPVLLPIHACWNPSHYAADALANFAGRLRQFSDTVVREAAERI